MAGGNLIAQIHAGMHVHTADGTDLGKITQVWYGSDPGASSIRCDEEVCSRVEVHHGLFGREVLYIPYSAIARVSGKVVTLTIAAALVPEQEEWYHKPAWIRASEGPPPAPPLGGLPESRI